MSKKLVWILAGGAVLVLGGAAIWLWRRRSKSPAKPSEQPPAPEPDDMPVPRTEPTRAQPPSMAREQFDLFASPATAQASAAPTVLEDAPSPTEPAVETPAAPAVLVPKQRRKRYPVGPGELIELRPNKVSQPASWSTSRPDVELRVVEQSDARTLVALDGPAGEVNVALLCEGPKGPRPITSWKFEIVDKVA